MEMETELLDLNINNYNYEDILNLFKINIDFGEYELKQAKRYVLLMHPDKSGLDKQYFLFFSAAFKILHSVYQFREKANISQKMDIDNQNTEYLTENDVYNKELLDSLKENNQMAPEKFNKWFNELFDKVKLENEYEKGGYGDWLKNTHDEDAEEELKHKNLTREQLINSKKNRLRDNVLSKKIEINEFNNLSCQSDLTNACPESYASGMFSKLQFEDLKIAHEESVVPVTDEDFAEPHSFEKLKLRRSRQNLTPLTENEAQTYLNMKNKEENAISSQRAYQLAKQEEASRKANDTFWSSLKQIK